MTNIVTEIRKNLISSKEKARLEYYRRLADHLVSEFKPVTIRELDDIRCSPTGELAPFGETFLASKLEELMGERYTPAGATAIFHHVKAMTYISLSHIRSPWNVIPVANGDLDVLTGELHYHKETKWQFLQRFEHIEYDPKAPVPKTFLRIFKEIQPDPEIRKRILRSFALCYDRTLLKRQCEIWMGEHDTGKTTLLKVLKRLTSPFCSNIGLQTFTNKRDLFALAGLVDQAANICGDLEEIEIEDVGVLKELLGGDTMSVRRMHHEPVSIPIYTKLFAACNGPPYIEKEKIWNDLAFWERFRVTHFRSTWISNVRDESLTLDEGREEESKLLNQVEISGIFNILIGVLRAVYLYKDYGFEFLPHESREAWRQGLLASDKISKVINELTILDEKKSIPVDEFFQVVNEKLRREGLGHVTRHDVNERMMKISHQSNDHRVRVWRGIGWKHDEEQGTLLNVNGVNGTGDLIVRTQLKVHGASTRRKPVNSVNFFEIPLRSWFGKFSPPPLTIPFSELQGCSSLAIQQPKAWTVLPKSGPEPELQLNPANPRDFISSETTSADVRSSAVVNDFSSGLSPTSENDGHPTLERQQRKQLEIPEGCHLKQIGNVDCIECGFCESLPAFFVSNNQRGLGMMLGHLKMEHGVS